MNWFEIYTYNIHLFYLLCGYPWILDGVSRPGGCEMALNEELDFRLVRLEGLTSIAIALHVYTLDVNNSSPEVNEQN